MDISVWTFCLSASTIVHGMETKQINCKLFVFVRRRAVPFKT
jgi:hypothetical protein